MNHTLPRFLIIGLLAGVSTTAMAQTDLSYLFTSRPKYWFSAGINVRAGGPSVKFSHLGSLPRSLFTQDPTTGIGENVYDDGVVGSDGPRAAESATGTKFNADKTRYQIFNTDGTVFADYLAYQKDETRIWTVDTAGQVSGDQVAFHFATARETGARDGGLGGTDNENGKSSGGFDIQLARDFGLIGKRASWGIAFSIGMNDISGKTSKVITADEVISTATYKLYNPIPSIEAVPTGTYYTAPSPATISQGSGGIEDTVAISQTAIDPGTGQPLAAGQLPQTTVIPNGATVTGSWKIKGAYYLMRLGPQFRYYASRRLSFSANAGIAAAYAGSDFDVDETMTAPIISTLTAQPTFVGTSHKREFMIGGYAEANTEFWITFRTGLYAGVVYEALGKYKHDFKDPVTNGDLGVADVNVGSGLSFRLGLITRF
jgi:hypothetical protein